MEFHTDACAFWLIHFLRDEKLFWKKKKLGFLIYENLKKSQFQILLNLLYDL